MMLNFGSNAIDQVGGLAGGEGVGLSEDQVQQTEQDTGMSTVLIAHREQMVIDAVTAELASQATQTRTASSVRELLDQVGRGLGLDAVILDYRLFPNSGNDQIRKIVARLGETPLILFAGSLEPRIIPLMLKAGVRGIIPETLPLKAIPSVLYLVRLGQVFTGALPHESATGEEAGANALTEEEYGVLRRAAEGDTNKEIAAQFNVTEVRVKMLMRAICRKFAARNRAHACVIAREQGLL